MGGGVPRTHRMRLRRRRHITHTTTSHRDIAMELTGIVINYFLLSYTIEYLRKIVPNYVTSIGPFSSCILLYRSYDTIRYVENVLLFEAG